MPTTIDDDVTKPLRETPEPERWTSTNDTPLMMTKQVESEVPDIDSGSDERQTVVHMMGPSPDGQIVVDNDTESDVGGDDDREVNRETWGKHIDFLLSVIGFAVDLSNVWRFPYLCYKNGGGAFLIPYVIILIFGGIPLFYMELALGQYNKTGAITLWNKICPMFKGIGMTVIVIAFYVDFYYNVIIAWALHFFISSFTTTLPWSHCNNPWNTEFCYDGLHNNNNNNNNESTINKLFSNETTTQETVTATMTSLINSSIQQLNSEGLTDLRTSPAAEYFERAVLKINHSTGFGDIGSLNWQLILCLAAVYTICYFSMWKGVKTSGKVVWVTATFPYIVLFVLLIRGVTLQGSATGISYYLTPNFTRLASSQVWIEAATQVFFSLGPGFGVLLAFSSYNQFHNNIFRDAITTSIINSATSFLAGFVIFSVLGFMADRLNKSIATVAEEGPGLVFIVYPEAIAQLPGSTAWSLIFFLMLLTLGLDSSFGGSEAIITAIQDQFPKTVGKRRELFILILFSVYFLIGLMSCGAGGAYMVDLLDKFSASYSILTAVLLEAIAVSWVYGVDRFADNIKEMIGTIPGLYWRICWQFLGPACLSFSIVFGLVQYTWPVYGDYVYPGWTVLLGWVISMSSVMFIPIYAIYSIATAPLPTLAQKCRYAITPLKERSAMMTTAYRVEMGKLNGRHSV